MANCISIPRILHFTWKDEKLPRYLDLFYKSWQNKHPDWQFILWTDRMNKSFVEQHFPNFLSKYKSYAHNIQRVDAVRYFILYQMGGVFADLDIECFKNIEPLLEGNDCILGLEPKAHSEEHSMPIIISNAFMACKPQHSFIAKVCDELFLPQQNRVKPFDYVLHSTGPFMLTRVYERYRPDNVSLLDPSLIFPLTKEEIQLVSSGRIDVRKIEPLLQDAYALHYFWGSWWKNKKVLSLQQKLQQARVTNTI